MAVREHRYAVTVEWTGNRGSGTSTYTAYGRDHRLLAAGKAEIAGSADPAFRGDPARWNPEELLLASVSACHKLWYLHLCAAAGVVVVAYRDAAEGVMVEDAAGGHFTDAVLRPEVTITPNSDAVLAEQLHAEAHRQCFIANSLNFPVRCEPVIVPAAG